MVCAGITGDYGLPWLKRYLAAAGTSCDVVGYHFYTKHRPPEAMLDTVAEVRRAMADAGLQDRPLWNTEAGWLVRH